MRASKLLHLLLTDCCRNFRSTSSITQPQTSGLECGEGTGGAVAGQMKAKESNVLLEVEFKNNNVTINLTGEHRTAH